MVMKFWEVKGRREGMSTKERGGGLAGREGSVPVGTDRGNSLQCEEKGRRSWEKGIVRRVGEGRGGGGGDTRD